MSFFRRASHVDSIDQDENDMVDPDLRLRTVRTAASTINESIRSESRREQRRRKRDKNKRKGSNLARTLFNRHKNDRPEPDPRDAPTRPDAVIAPSSVAGQRRNIYVNVPLPASEVDVKNEPISRYARNKVRTSKYTLITFVPKNLTEQFRRLANVYFLVTVILAVFPAFGATTPQVAMLPLVFIICATAAKDGIEDYRRASLDDEVNNSAATKLGDWRNVNQPTDPRTWFERTFGIGIVPGKVTTGVRKLREREAHETKDFVLTREGEESMDPDVTLIDTSRDSIGHHAKPSLDDIRSVGSAEERESSLPTVNYSYPPRPTHSAGNLSLSAILPDENGQTPIGASSQYALSTRSKQNSGVVNWDRQTSGTARWERTLWKKLEVGDVVLLRDNEQIPADIVVLSTSDANGLCYIETKNLDGETNLKQRKSLHATSSILSEEDVEHASFVLDSEPPHPNLYAYNGVLKYRSRPSEVNPTSQSSAEKLEPVTINEFLLRGCTVRNTKWIIGLVVFTGADTKIMLNGGDTPTKRSKIEKETNFNVVMNFIVLVLMCIGAAIGSGVYYADEHSSGEFFYEREASTTGIPGIEAIITFASALIAFQNIVPISLYISIEIVKTIQAFFISQDTEMYYAPLDTACVPKTWNISDDLGQIEYIFSDKTGTLTQNIMEFQKCSIQGVSYGDGVTEAMRGAAVREGKQLDTTPEEEELHLRALKEEMIQTMQRRFKNRWAQNDKLTLISPKLADDLTNPSSPQRGHIIAFYRALALCHTVLADKPEPRERPFELVYKAESPDEAALVAAARDVGFPYVGRSNSAVDIEVMGQPERYVPLRVLEFNSTRKRMSVILRTPEGRLILYCKGADSVIYARLAPNHDVALKDATSRDLEAFANGGLRTLCIAYRYLEEAEYLDWSRKYDAAAAAVNDREEEIEKASELIEKDLTILGATALEDKLQEGVPQAIEILHRAGIKLWILTGDKVQTAIEIGFSCNLLKNDMEIMILSADNADAARLQIEGGLNKIASMMGPPNMQGRKEPQHTGGFAVVIDGETLRYALDPTLKSLFLNLGTQCDTVVCCRVSPAQKALTVKLVKEGRNAMTLSIGDGANDVAMIQEANIGCGLFGLEGSQAAMSADYAFGQFRFLTRLLLVHGRWSYLRIADMHSNFFYKNVIWTFAMFWFLIFNNWDSTYLYQVTFILLYNVAFTSLPVVVLGAFDQDLNAKASLAFPQLYKRGILGLEYTRRKFWLYMFDGLYQSAIVFFIPYIVWTTGEQAISAGGRTIESLADFGTTVSVAVIFSANIFVGLSFRYWTALTWIVVVGSTLLPLIWIAIYSQFQSMDFINEINILFATIDFWGTIILSTALAVGPRFVAKALSQSYYPLDKDIIREAWVLGDLKDQLGIKHRYRKNILPQDFGPSHDIEQPYYDDDGVQGDYMAVQYMSPPSQPRVIQTAPLEPSSSPPPSPTPQSRLGDSSPYPTPLSNSPAYAPAPSSASPASTLFPTTTSPHPSTSTNFFTPSATPTNPFTPISFQNNNPQSPVMSSVSPSALVHDPRGPVANLSSNEYEMRLRSAFPSPALGTPEEVHTNQHDKHLINPHSASATPPGTPGRPSRSQLSSPNPYAINADEPSWSAGGQSMNDPRASYAGPQVL